MALTKIDDRGLKTPIDLQDNEQIRLGTGNDFKLYHDGSHTYFDNDTGHITATTAQFNINNFDNSENCATFVGNGAVNLFYDGTKRLETKSDGARFTGHLYCNDNEKLRLGTGHDLQIYHDGSNSYIKDSGTGGLLVNSSGFDILNAADNEFMGRFIQDGSVELYENGTKVAETTAGGWNVEGVTYSNGLDMDDNHKILLGTGDDLQIYHDGSNSIIEDTGTGQLRLCGDNAVVLRKTPTGDVYALGNADGSFELFYDNSKRLQTEAWGARIFATGQDTRLVIQGEENRSCDLTLQCDDGDDYPDYTRFHKNKDTGKLHIQNYASGSWEDNIVLNNDGAVELYHDNGLKCLTGGDGLYFPHHGTLHDKAIHFETAQSSGDYGTLFGVTNYPDATNYTGQGVGHWARIQAKGGCVVVINSDASSKNDGRNNFDHFSIYQKAGESTNGKRLFSVDGEGRAQFGRAGIVIDNSWDGQPCILVQRNNNIDTDNTDNSAYFRIHGGGDTHESWTGGSSGSDFSANLLIDGTTYGTSDRRAKTDIIDCPYGLDVVNKLQPRKFQLVNSVLEPQGDGNINLGFIAQEIKEHIPECVNYLGDEADKPNEKGYAKAYALDIGEVIPVLTKAIQELSTQVKTLQTKVAALEAT